MYFHESENIAIEMSLNQGRLVHSFQLARKHFHRNNSIYKITTPLLRSEGGILQTDAAQLFRFDPIPAKAKKLGLLSIYKFSLPSPETIFVSIPLKQAGRWVQPHSLCLSADPSLSTFFLGGEGVANFV